MKVWYAYKSIGMWEFVDSSVPYLRGYIEKKYDNMYEAWVFGFETDNPNTYDYIKDEFVVDEHEHIVGHYGTLSDAKNAVQTYVKGHTKEFTYRDIITRFHSIYPNFEVSDYRPFEMPNSIIIWDKANKEYLFVLCPGADAMFCPTDGNLFDDFIRRKYSHEKCNWLYPSID